LGQTLQEFWQRFAWCFRTNTRDTSPYALAYLSAQLRLETERNFTNIGRVSNLPMQNIQHFISNSFWDAGTPLWNVQKEIVYNPHLQQGAHSSWMRAPTRKPVPKLRERAANTMGGLAKSR
jgi:hypothetical protein